MVPLCVARNVQRGATLSPSTIVDGYFDVRQCNDELLEERLERVDAAHRFRRERLRDDDVARRELVDDAQASRRPDLNDARHDGLVLARVHDHTLL